MDWHIWLPSIFGALTLLGTSTVIYFHYINRRAHELEDKESLAYFREQLADSRWAARYRTTLERGLERAEAFFGKPSSWQALNICWLIALVYPLLLFLLTWVFGGPHMMGALEILPPDWSFVQRLAFFLVLICYYYGVYWLIINQERIDAWVNSSLENLFSKHERSQSISERGQRLIAAMSTGIITGLVIYVGTNSIAFAGLSALVVAVAGVVIIAGAFAVAGAVAISGIITGVEIVVFAGASAFIGVVVGTIVFARTTSRKGIFPEARTVAGVGVIATSFVYSIGVYFRGEWEAVFDASRFSIIVFLILLPLLNGLLDYVSWAVSRTMGQWLLKKGRYTGLLLAFADFILALGLLIVLAWVLCLAVEGINQLAVEKTGAIALDLEGLLSQAADEPFRAGFWITAMLFSTLVPTVLHLLFAVGSVFVLHGKPDERNRWVEEIEAVEEGRKEQINRVHRRLIARYLLLHRWAGAVALSVGIVVAVGWGWSTFVYDLSDTLLAIATSARTFVGG